MILGEGCFAAALLRAAAKKRLPQPFPHTDAGAAADEIVINRNNADANPIGIRRRHNGAELGCALRFLCNDNEIDMGRFQDCMQAIHPAQIPRQGFVGGFLQIAGQMEGLRIFLTMAL